MKPPAKIVTREGQTREETSEFTLNVTNGEEGKPFKINPAEIAPSSLPDKPIRNLKKSSQDHQTSGYPLALFYILELVKDADCGL